MLVGSLKKPRRHWRQSLKISATAFICGAHAVEPTASIVRLYKSVPSSSGSPRARNEGLLEAQELFPVSNTTEFGENMQNQTGSNGGSPNRPGVSPTGPIAAFILAGKTGSGKSSLIKLLGGRDLVGDEPIVDGGLDSCTRSPTIYLTTLNNRKVLLLDTPGFDDSAVENLQVLNEIAANLYTFALQRQDIETRGVIFLHDISETRFGGSQRKTLEILKALCGPKGMKNCVIGTTLWNNPGSDRFRKEEIREKDFLRSHWKGILKTTRIPEGDRDVVVGVINDILARPPVLLQLQEEMLKPPHTLENTTAGKIAIPEGRAEAEQLRREFEEQQKQFKEERERQQADFEQQQEETRRQFEEERARQEEERQRLEEERWFREGEQRKQHQEEMRNLDEEHRQRAEEQENRRRADDQNRHQEERARWEEYMKAEKGKAERAEKEREKRYEEERKRVAEETRLAREREDERMRMFMEELKKSAAPPPPRPGFFKRVWRSIFG